MPAPAPLSSNDDLERVRQRLRTLRAVQVQQQRVARVWQCVVWCGVAVCGVWCVQQSDAMVWCVEAKQVVWC